METEEERRARLENDAATKRLRLAMETQRKKSKTGEVGATERLRLAMEKMVATEQLRLAMETEEERRARLEHLSDNPIYTPNNLYLILIVAF